MDTICARHAVAVPGHAEKVIVCADMADEAQDSGWVQTRFFYLLIETERAAVNSLVPFLLAPQG